MSKKQNMIAWSNCETEYKALAHTICEILWLKQLLQKLNLTYPTPINIYYDNKSEIFIIYNLVINERTKHVDVNFYFVWKIILNYCTPYIRLGKQLANIFAKTLG